MKISNSQLLLLIHYLTSSTDQNVHQRYALLNEIIDQQNEDLVDFDFSNIEQSVQAKEVTARKRPKGKL